MTLLTCAIFVFELVFGHVAALPPSKQDGFHGQMEFTGELVDDATISGVCVVVGVQEGTFTLKKHVE